MTIPIAEKDLVQGIILTMRMWCRPGYQLPFGKRQALSERWFKEFIGKWSVARTIRADKQEALRHLLNEQIVDVAWSADSAGAVVKFAREVARRRMTTRSQNGRRRVPISLVSKIAFFYHPTKLAPYDSYARNGLNKRVERRLDYGNYEAFVTEFNLEFRHVRQQVKKECSARWTKALCHKMGMRLSALESSAFHRKVFDNVLMIEAGRFD